MPLDPNVYPQDIQDAHWKARGEALLKDFLQNLPSYEPDLIRWMKEILADKPKDAPAAEAKPAAPSALDLLRAKLAG